MGEMSEMSVMSSVDSGGAPETTTQSEDNRRALLPVIVVCVVLLLIIGIGVFMSNSGNGDDMVEESENSAGSGGGDGPGGSQNSYGPQSSTGSKSTITAATSMKTTMQNTTRRATNRTTATTLKTRTTISTTTTKAVNDLLMCTVASVRLSETAFLPVTLPSDGICDLLFFFEVRILRGNGGLEITPYGGVANQRTLKEFLQRGKSYVHTQLGLGIHAEGVLYGDVNKILNTSECAELVRRVPVYHYGYLDVLHIHGRNWTYFEMRKRELSAFKACAPSDKNSKTVIAMRNVATGNGTFLQYKAFIKRAIKERLADIIIPITSSGRIPCKGPLAVINYTNNDYMTLEEAGPLLSNSNNYSKDVVLGVSLAMGATRWPQTPTNCTYTMFPFTDPDMDIWTRVLYALPDKGCEAPAEIRRVFPEVGVSVCYFNASEQNDQKEFHYFYDNNQTYHEKVTYVRNLPLWRNFAWLIYHVNLAHTSPKCEWDPYYLPKLIKGIYN